MDRLCKEKLKKRAYLYKKLYLNHEVTEEQAREMIEPYLHVINESLRRVARGYRLYFQRQTFEKFMNYRY